MTIPALPALPAPFWLLLLALLAVCVVSEPLEAQPSSAGLRAGTAVVDVTPTRLPVLVNGGMTSRSVDKVKTRVNARALALSDGSTRIAICVVDSCMMGRELLDEVKTLAARRTGIPTNRITISATHAHSAPASMGCLGTDADPAYVPFLRDRIVEAISQAAERLEPARIGFGKANAAAFNASRQWIRRPDRVEVDPFGNRTVRANMHAGRNWDDVTGEAGPKDPDLQLISVQSREGRPIAVLANYSMHYFSDQDISADYFGLFCEGLASRLSGGAAAGVRPFVGLISHGCSGDIWRRDYTRLNEWNDKLAIEEYTRGLLDVAMGIYRGIRYQENAPISMAERRMTMNYRVPDLQRLEWAQRIVAAMGDRLPKTQTEVYAREQILLHQKQKTEVVVQAVRIGDMAIATTPCETYAVTGLKIKAASPLKQTMVIELANGGDGYIPPPEQHLFGGYNTWAARSAGLETTAEPRIAEAAIGLLEHVTGRPRRPWTLPNGAAAKSVLALKPTAYWRLNEVSGPHAADAGPRGLHAVYEREVTYYLEGARSAAFCGPEETNRAPQFVGGRLRARLTGVGDRCSVSMWVWNGMPTEGRDVAGWLLSRGPDYGMAPSGEHLGIGGKSGHTGRLVYLPGGANAQPVAGSTVLPRWQWQHVAFTREGGEVKVYLNGKLELTARAPEGAAPEQWFFGGRSDGDSSWEGRLDEIAVFSRALTPEEAARLAIP